MAPNPAVRRHNRLAVALRHTRRFAFDSQARLADACGVSRSTISRIVSGKSEPSLQLAERIAIALADDMGVPLTPRDLFSPDGTYKEPSGCRLCGCSGCFPDEAYDRKGNLKPAFYQMRPGDWSRASANPILQILARPAELLNAAR